MEKTNVDVLISFLSKRLKEVEDKNRSYPSENVQDRVDKSYGYGFVEGLRFAIKAIEKTNKP